MAVDLWGAVTDTFSNMLGLVGQFITALVSGSLAQLLPLFAIGISISVIMVAVKIVRKVTWGA